MAGYKPKRGGRVWVICPNCKKRFSINGAEHRYRFEKFNRDPCCSRPCSEALRKEKRAKDNLNNVVTPNTMYGNYNPSDQSRGTPDGATREVESHTEISTGKNERLVHAGGPDGTHG